MRLCTGKGVVMGRRMHNKEKVYHWKETQGVPIDCGWYFPYMREFLLNPPLLLRVDVHTTTSENSINILSLRVPR